MINLARGLRSSIKSHEKRRVSVYEKGYKAYIQKAQSGSGGQAKKCGTVCYRLPGKARQELQTYLTALRKKAKADFKTYYITEQERIDGENSGVNTVQNGRVTVGDFRPLSFTHVGAHRKVTINKPSAFTRPPCK